MSQLLVALLVCLLAGKAVAVPETETKAVHVTEELKPQLKSKLKAASLNDEPVKWPFGGSCLSTSITQSVFDATWTSEFRDKNVEQIKSKFDPPVDVDADHYFYLRQKGLKCTAHLKEIKVGPLVNLSLPQEVTLTDIKGSSSFLNGDGSLLQSSPTNITILGTGRVHVSCSACVFGGKIGRYFGGSSSNCQQWFKFCNLDANLKFKVQGVATVRGKECLEASVATIEQCRADLPACVFASAIDGDVNIGSVDTTIADVSGGGVCMAAGITKSYLNDALDDQEEYIAEHLNEALEKSFVDDVNMLLAEENIRPYAQHP